MSWAVAALLTAALPLSAVAEGDDPKTKTEPQKSVDAKIEKLSVDARVEALGDGRVIIVTPDGTSRLLLQRQPKLHGQDALPSGLLWALKADDGEVSTLDVQTPPKYVIGVGVSPVPPIVWSQLKREGGGIAVSVVMDDGPAKAAGVQENDIILQANDRAVTEQKLLMDVVQEAADKPVRLRLLRGGEELTIEVTPKENEQANQPAASFVEKGLPEQLLHWDVHQFAPGMVLTQPPADGDLRKDLEALRNQIQDLQKSIEELKGKTSP
ncbi:MAG: PDZ domain-containing protein [Planctomyces sp.]|nr:PDZ domain-containing protein [Planctomyces sp.]